MRADPRRLWVVGLVGGLALIAQACGGGGDGAAGSTEESGTVEVEPSSGGETRVEATPGDAAALDPDRLALRVYTSLAMSPHYSRSSGRWFRRTERRGWEQADCMRTVVFDPGTTSAPPTCGAWTAVPAGEVATVERIAAERREVSCAEQPGLCAELGLRAE